MKYCVSLGFLLLIIIYSCGLGKNKKNNGKNDPFYENKGHLGLRRIPLIKPYELLKVSANEWRMELLTPDLLSLSVHNVKGINISKGKILICSEGGTEVRNIQYNQLWFIIDPLTHKELAFNNYKTYSDSLNNLDIIDTLLSLPDLIYKNFYETGKLKWNE
jgi:hypothetical protein